VSDTDFAAIMGPVASHADMWGPPSNLVTPHVLRWGGQGSRKVDLESGTWFDHESGDGGGVLDLVMKVLGSDKHGALDWLGDAGFIDKRDSGQIAPRQRPIASGGDNVPVSDESQPELTVDEEQGKLVDVCGYTYTDRDGNKLYQVLRQQWKLADGSWKLDPKTGNPKKTFKQRRPDGAGGWVYNLDGIGHCLYRAQELDLAIAEGKTVHIVEGEKDADTLAAWGLCGTTNSGGAQHWRPELVAMFKGADVVILVDNDEVGIKAGEVKAKSLRGVASRIRVLNFADHVPGFPAKGDVTDWRDRFGGTAKALQNITENIPDWRPRPPASEKFRAVGLDQLHLPWLKHDFLIDGFLDRRGVAMMPGSSGSGKTFLTLEMGMCVATHRPFWGMDVKPGLVIYQAGEGKEGVTKRLDGWLLDRGVEPSADVPFRMLPRKINLFVDDKDTDDLIAECKDWSDYYAQPVRLVIIDTFNKAITGANENAGQDMTRVLSRLERISETLDCAVLVPMHKSKQGDMRGHTSLTGDVSNVINVTKLEITDQNGRPIRTAALDKNKDGEGGRPARFVLRQVVTGMDGDKPITTCVVDKPNGDDDALTREGKLSPPQTIFLNTLKNCLDTDGTDGPASLRVSPHMNRVVKYATFEQRLRARWPFTAPEHEIEKRNKEFKQSVGDAGKRLVASGYVDRDNDIGMIWWTGKSDRPRPPRKEAAPVAPPDQRLVDEVPF
jgi:hypothetical protein